MQPKIELTQIKTTDGTPNIMIYIRNANAELASECERLGYFRVCPSEYKIHCTSAAMLDAARNPLRKFFS
jgi:hypothetical protein